MPPFVVDPATISILVVDDEPANFGVIDPVLSQEGYSVIYVPSAERALARLQTLRPNLILLDVMMPGMDGLECCQKIKENPEWQWIPIIMITALASKQDLANCLAVGADDFISKPVDFQELTARVRSILKIYEQQRQIQALLSARDAMFHSIVHDLRNPLNSIVFTTDMLKENDLKMSDRQWERLNRSVDKMSRLINDILILGKLESAKVSLNLEAIDLKIFGEKALDDAATFADQKHIKLLGEFPLSGTMASLDFYLIRRTIDNLLMNAIKFSNTDSSITFTIDRSYSNQVKFMVSDLGYGIADDLKATIFNPYTSTDVATDVAKIGLGLTFCKTVAEAHGGTIGVSDNYPQGSVFTLMIPTP